MWSGGEASKARLLPTTSRRAHERRCLDGLICLIAACGTFYTVGAPGAATVSVAV